MKRREFIHRTAAAGAALAAGSIFDIALPLPAHAIDTGGGIGIGEGLSFLDEGKARNVPLAIRPEILAKPRAVFLIETRAEGNRDERGFYTEVRPQLVDIGRDVAGRIFVKGEGKGGSTVILPNWTSLQDQTLSPVVGVNTSVDFIAGFVETLRGLGNTNVILTERGGNMLNRRRSGMYGVMDEHGLKLIEAAYARFDDYDKSEINWRKVPGKPQVWHRIPFDRPVGDPDNFFINMPKLKCHNLGLTTLSMKNLQGSIPTGYGHFCNQWASIELAARTTYNTDFGNFEKNYYQNVERAFLAHRAAGFKHWDVEQAYPKYEAKGGWEAFRKIPKTDGQAIAEFMKGMETVFYDETWAQRDCDAASSITPTINIVEGVIGRDGSGFQEGTDFLTNYVVVGMSMPEVDAVASYIMGQNPLELFYTRIAKERGMGETNPAKIEINVIRDNGAVEPLPGLDSIRVTPLGVALHGRWYGEELYFW